MDGAYALHSTLRSLLDIRVAVVKALNPKSGSSRETLNRKNILTELILAQQVGGLHFSLLSKVQHDIGDTCSLDYLIDSIFPLFRKHIEPNLHHAQVGLLCLLF